MIALSLVVFIKKTIRKPAKFTYLLIVLHLASNAIWTPLFFFWRSPGLALLDILFLDLSLLYLIIQFWKTSKLSSKLLWPYLAWVLFATYLNAGFYLLNRAN
jgi:translocator protein